MSRITRKEISHLLPPCQVRAFPQETGKSADKVWKEWATEASLSANKVCLLFHRRASVHKAAAALQSLKSHGWLIVATSGEDPATQRDGIIARAREAEKSILLTTMHAVKESINLSWVDRVLLAELYWRPATLTQVVGRFGRPGGVSTILDVMCLYGTVYERMAVSVSDKLLDSAGTLPEGQTEGALRGALGRTEEDEANLMSLATSVVFDDEYAELEEVNEDE